jgi:ABC-type oligopeptide transport system ATPase subunit
VPDFIGRKDALSLLAASAGVLASNPFFAGDPYLAVLAASPFLAGRRTAEKLASSRFNRIDEDATENFVLPSDPGYGDLMSTQQGIRLGYTTDKVLPVDVPFWAVQRHLALIGSSGVGKTTLGEYILWQQILMGGGFIFIDAKLDIDTINKVTYMMKLAGRWREMYIMNIDDPKRSHSYNPIIQGDADEISSRLMNLQPSTESSPGADFYRQSAAYALTVLIGALKAAKRRFHFLDLAILLQSGRAMAELERMIPPGNEKMALQVFLDQFRKRNQKGAVEMDMDRIKTVLGGMVGRLAGFSQDKFGQVFNTYTPEIDLTDIVQGNKCLYVALPTMGKDTQALSLAKMVLSDLRTAVYRTQKLTVNQRPSPPFLIFADEMGSYVLPGISRVFEQARSASIAMMPAFQSFANLATVSKDFTDMLVQNIWTKVFFKFGSTDSAEYAAELLGSIKRSAFSVSLSETEGASASNIRVTPQGSESKGGGLSQSWRETEDYRVSPEKLKALGMGECVVMSGPRIYHVKTPMLKFPTVPAYEIVRHKVRMPADEHPLDMKGRYKEFLLSGGEEERSLPAAALEGLPGQDTLPSTAVTETF